MTLQTQPLPPLLADPNLDEVKVLLVDDRPENLISLESLLRKKGENITYLTAKSGEEVLKIALREELALILLDVQMPGMNGYEVARYLRNISKTREIPIIFVTAIDEDTNNMVEGFEAGAVDFLFKPLHPYITKAKVSTFVRFYRQKKTLERTNALVIHMNQDLEERVRDRTQELVKINNDLDTFIYTASHDLKAPINNIESLMQVLQGSLTGEITDAGEVEVVLGMIDGAINRFKTTLKDLTELAQIQNEGPKVTDKGNISFSEMLEEVKLTIKDLIEEADVLLEEDFAEAPAISYSRKNLRSILYNLVSNAIKYRSLNKRAEVYVRTFRQGEYLVLTVRDNGLGIKKENHHKVFDMFKRLHDHVEGTGVGMAIVKRIIENSGGRIELESEVGRGSMFAVYLKA